MPLPAGFPTPPKRPPDTVQPLSENGKFAPAWIAYFDALDRFNAAVRNLLAAS